MKEEWNIYLGSNDTMSTLRNYLKRKEKKLYKEADILWQKSVDIHDRQSKVGGNLDGRSHVEQVESNIWRLIKETKNASKFKPVEIFLLSCCACCHDFDKGLLNSGNPVHGKDSAVFVIDKHKKFFINDIYSHVICKVIEIHDFATDKFKKNLEELSSSFPLPNGSVNLKRAAVLLKAADILHTDNSRVTDLAVDENKLDGFKKSKHLARKSISGWEPNGDRIIINAIPPDEIHRKAVEECFYYIKKYEWPAVEKELESFYFPHKLEFMINNRLYIPHVDDTNPFPNVLLGLPPRPENFIDRAEILDQLKNNLKPGTLITLCGPSGVGKTAIALEAIYQLYENEDFRFPDGIIYHSFFKGTDGATEERTEIFFEQIARFFKEGTKPTTKTAAQRALAGKKVLLFLDNAEDAKNLHEVKSIAGTCGILITTWFKEDAGKIRLDIKPMEDDDAIQLLKVWGKLQVIDNLAANEICKLVGKLPLAVVLAGRCLEITNETESEYLVRLQNDTFKTLNSEARKNNNTPESIIRRSINRLSSRAVESLGIIGVLDFLPFPYDMITRGLKVDLDEAKLYLKELVSYGILNRVGDQYEVSHRLVHTYVRNNHTPQEEYLENLTKFYIERIKRLIGNPREKSGNFANYKAIEPEIYNIFSVIKWNQAHNSKFALQLIIELGYFFRVREYWEDGDKYWSLGSSIASELAETTTDDNEKIKYRETSFRFKMYLAYMAIFRGKTLDAERLTKKLRHELIFRVNNICNSNIEQSYNTASLIRLFGLIEYQNDNVYNSLRFLRRSHRIMKEIQSNEGVCRVQNDICDIILLSFKQEAFLWLESTNKLAKESQDSIEHLRCLRLFGDYYRYHGDQNKASEYYKLKFHRFVITKTCSSYESEIIFAGFALHIANSHKINSRRRYPLTNKIYDFSMGYVMQ